MIVCVGGKRDKSQRKGDITRPRIVCKRRGGRRDVRDRIASKKKVTRTPFSIMAILSARRAVVSRWVIQITVLTRSPDGRRDTSSIVSNISFWACASSADVYMGYTRSGSRFSKMEAGWGKFGWGRRRGGGGDGVVWDGGRCQLGFVEECRLDECITEWEQG